MPVSGKVAKSKKDREREKKGKLTYQRNTYMYVEKIKIAN